MVQLFIARTKVLTLFPAMLRPRITPRLPIDEEVDTRSENSTTNGLPLQTRAPKDTTPSSVDLA